MPRSEPDGREYNRDYRGQCHSSAASGVELKSGAARAGNRFLHAFSKLRRRRIRGRCVLQNPFNALSQFLIRGVERPKLSDALDKSPLIFDELDAGFAGLQVTFKPRKLIPAQFIVEIERDAGADVITMLHAALAFSAETLSS